MPRRAPCVRAHCAAQGGGSRLRPRSTRPAHRHAQVLGLDNDGHAERVELFVEKVRYLRGQPLLKLGTASKAVNDSRELREPYDSSVARDICNMRPADKRQKMVLAHGIHRYVAHNDQFLVFSSLKSLTWRLGSSSSPEKISSYIRATRSGVSTRPSLSGSSPTAASISRTAASILFCPLFHPGYTRINSMTQWVSSVI